MADRSGSYDVVQLGKPSTERGNIPEGTGVFTAYMIDHRSVELFCRPAAFTPLEILYGIRSVRYRLQGG